MIKELKKKKTGNKVINALYQDNLLKTDCDLTEI